MVKISAILDAIINADNEISKLPTEVLELPSFSSAKIKHLLNNLGALSEQYFEVGLHKAGTFIATLYKNDVMGIGVDNWSQFEQDGLSKKLAYEHVEKYLPPQQYRVIEADCWEIKDLPVIDMFSYDGEHSFENQKRGITHFYPYMADEFILCVDDTSWKDPRKGTEAGIKEMNLEILFEHHLYNPNNSEWHNGFSVYLLKKTK